MVFNLSLGAASFPKELYDNKSLDNGDKKQSIEGHPNGSVNRYSSLRLSSQALKELQKQQQARRLANARPNNSAFKLRKAVLKSGSTPQPQPGTDDLYSNEFTYALTQEQIDQLAKQVASSSPSSSLSLSPSFSSSPVSRISPSRSTTPSQRTHSFSINKPVLSKK